MEEGMCLADLARVQQKLSRLRWSVASGSEGGFEPRTR